MKIKKATRTEVIKKAIIEYYDSHSQDINPYELGKDLFGKHGAGETLSLGYKNKIKEKLDEKHPH